MKRSLCTFSLSIALGMVGTVQAGYGQQPAARDAAGGEDVRATYLLGPDDQIAIRALDAEEISDKPVRIDMSGYIHLPMIGRVKAAGLTAEQLEKIVNERLKTYLVEPDASVFIVEFHSQPVSVVGAVKTPGVIQLQGHKRLVEALSMAGGLADDAGHSVKIARRLEQGRIPLPNAKDDPTGAFSVAEVSLKEIMEAQNPAENIVICPEDVITVPKAEMVYVLGQVPRAGGYVLHERESLSVLQALTLAGGLDRAASPAKAKIMRAVAGSTSRTEIPIDLKKIMAGQAGDMAMQMDDILFVPASAGKKALLRGADAAMMMTTAAVYHF